MVPQHANTTPTATARMNYPYTCTYTDHRSNHVSGLDLNNGGMVQLAATTGGRDASSASCPSIMATSVDTFANTLTPDDVDINEQGDVILPADFFWDKFKKIADKSAAQVELEFFTRTNSYFPVFNKAQRDDNGRATFVPAEL